MSKIAKIAVIALISVVFTSLAFADSDNDYYVASPSEIIDLNVQQKAVDSNNDQNNVVSASMALPIEVEESIPNTNIDYQDDSYKPVERPKAKKSSKGILSDITTNFNFDVNTYANENEPISQAQISANFTASKGPVYFQYSHSRNYSRIVDSYSGYVEDEFYGTVNNRFSVGISFRPDFSGKKNVAVADNHVADSTASVAAAAYTAGN